MHRDHRGVARLLVLGQRYADRKFPLSADWHKNHSYIQNHPVRDILASDDPTAIGRLRPR